MSTVADFTFVADSPPMTIEEFLALPENGIHRELIHGPRGQTDFTGLGVRASGSGPRGQTDLEFFRASGSDRFPGLGVRPISGPRGQTDLEFFRASGSDRFRIFC